MEDNRQCSLKRDADKGGGRGWEGEGIAQGPAQSRNGINEHHRALWLLGRDGRQLQGEGRERG